MDAAGIADPGGVAGWATAQDRMRAAINAILYLLRAGRPRAYSVAIQDRDGTGLVLGKIRQRFPCLELIWADGCYNAWQVDAALAKVQRAHMETAKRSDDTKGFVVMPRRWAVERMFFWFGRNRRLAKDFENAREPWSLSEPSLSSSCLQAAFASVGRKLNKPPAGDARSRTSANRIVKGPSPECPTMTRLRS